MAIATFFALISAFTLYREGFTWKKIIMTHLEFILKHIRLTSFFHVKPLFNLQNQIQKEVIEN